MMEQEIWKPVEGYTGYEVSNMGKVRKCGHSETLRIVKGCGMRRVTLRKKDEYHLVVIAKLVLEHFVNKMPAGHKATCIDGNYEHLSVDNLCWVVRRKKRYNRHCNKSIKADKEAISKVANHINWIKRNGKGKHNN